MDNAGSQVTSTSSVEDLGHPGNPNPGGKSHTAVVSSSDALLAPLSTVVAFTLDDVGSQGLQALGTHRALPVTPKDNAGSEATSKHRSIQALIPGNPTHRLSPLATPFFPAVGTSLHLVGPSSGPAICRALSCSCTESDTDIPSDRHSTAIESPPLIVSSPSAYTVGRNVVHPCTNTTPNQTLSHPTPALPKPARFCLQWNMNGFFNNLADLEILTSSDPPWILALQEVNRVTLEQLNRSLGGRYVWNLKRGSNFRHSVALGVLKSIPSAFFNIDSQLPAIGVKVQGSTTMSVACVYLPCGNIPNLRGEVEKIIQQLPEPRMVVGDLNAHHPAWGGSRSDSRGNTLLNLFEDSDLTILNDGSPTFFNSRYSTAIDVTAVTRSEIGRFSWCVNSDPHGSDHHPLQISLAVEAPVTTSRPRWLYDQADWTAYNSSICVSRNHCRRPGKVFRQSRSLWDV